MCMTFTLFSYFFNRLGNVRKGKRALRMSLEM